MLVVLYIIYMDIVFYMVAGWLENKKKTINGWLIVWFIYVIFLICYKGQIVCVIMDIVFVL